MQLSTKQQHRETHHPKSDNYTTFVIVTKQDQTQKSASMELTFGSSFTVALLSCLYISLITCPVVTAKCHGRWAIHACFGGNGKRSDPNMSPSTDELPPTLLRQLLVSDVQRLSRLLREPEAPVEDADLSPNPGFEPGQSNEQLMPRLAAPEPVDETTLSRLENYRQMLKNRYFRWKGF